MSSKQYLKNQLHVILLNILGVLTLALFLIAIGTSIHAISLIALVWIVVVFCYLTILYFSRKRHLNELLAMIDQLEEKYLLHEVLDMPERAEEQVFYQILKMTEKSMLEKIGEIYRERQEYKEYIEQWVHEIKTPITAMKLMCENHRSEFTRELLVEIENVHRFTEQALYYARSEHTEKDYFIKETLLSDVIHDAIADNKYLLCKHHVVIEVEDTGESACIDDKWVRFILNQIISNGVKYRSHQPVLRFSTAQENNHIILAVEDDGMGFPKSDPSRIFEKGFTGQNGRAVHSSTGIDTKASIFVLQAAMIYAAVVLMVICLTVLSLQQLLDANQYQYRFSVLCKLGVEDHQIGKLVLKQLGVWFGLPIALAIIVAVVVIAYFIQTISAEIIAYIGFDVLMAQIGITAGILVLLLICYFASTWLLFQRSIR